MNATPAEADRLALRTTERLVTGFMVALLTGPDAGVRARVVPEVERLVREQGTELWLSRHWPWGVRARANSFESALKRRRAQAICPSGPGSVALYCRGYLRGVTRHPTWHINQNPTRQLLLRIGLLAGLVPDDALPELGVSTASAQTWKRHECRALPERVQALFDHWAVARRNGSGA